MNGLRARSAREFGIMRSKLEKKTIDRNLLIAQAIKDNQMWNGKFTMANKLGHNRDFIPCSCDMPTFIKTIADKFVFCTTCKSFAHIAATP